MKLSNLGSAPFCCSHRANSDVQNVLFLKNKFPKQITPCINNSERPVDALAENGKLLTHSLTDNFKSRDASASKKVNH